MPYKYKYTYLYSSQEHEDKYTYLYSFQEYEVINLPLFYIKRIEYDVIFFQSKENDKKI
jgi:hypothetical protein